jgi:hypothetical protein
MNTMTKRGILGYLDALKSEKEGQKPVMAWASLRQKREGNEWQGVFKLHPDSDLDFAGIYALLPDEYFCRSLALHEGQLTINLELNGTGL